MVEVLASAAVHQASECFPRLLKELVRRLWQQWQQDTTLPPQCPLAAVLPPAVHHEMAIAAAAAVYRPIDWQQYQHQQKQPPPLPAAAHVVLLLP
jgi:hypothetical protein